MARAMVEGILRVKAVPVEAIACVGGSGGSAQKLAADTGIQRLDSTDELVDGSKVIVLAFKPQHLETLNPDLRKPAAGKQVLSVLAGVTIHRLMQFFPSAANIVRAMPNMPASIGCGVTGFATWKSLEGEPRRKMMQLLESMGAAIEVEEHQLDAVTGISGSGVAFVYEFVRALRDAGKYQGLSEQESARFVLETVLGGALLLRESGLTPEEIQETIMTRGGTTEAGMTVLRKGGLDRLVQEAVAAAAERSREIAGKT